MMVLYAIILVTVLFSMKGFQDYAFFEKYKFSVAGVQRKEYIRLLSAGFLHANWMHLIFNMMTLYFFAPIAIQAFGSIGFLIVYFGSMLLGNAFCLYLYKNIPGYSAIGASGAVSGILFAAIAIFPFLDLFLFFIPIPIKGYIFGFFYFGYSVYMMLNPNQNDNIGHAAHIGGAFFGLVYAIGMAPSVAMDHALELGILSLPLLYLGYQIFIKKKIY